MSKAEKKPESDPVKKPNHYTWHSLFECRELTSVLPFNEGNVIKYLYRAGEKEDRGQDIEKGLQYVEMSKETPMAMKELIFYGMQDFLAKINQRLNQRHPAIQYFPVAVYNEIRKEFKDKEAGRLMWEVLNAYSQANMHDMEILGQTLAKVMEGFKV